MHKPAMNLGLGFRYPTCVRSYQVSYIGFWNPNVSLSFLAFRSHICSNNSIILVMNYIGCIKSLTFWKPSPSLMKGCLPMVKASLANLTFSTSFLQVLS
jgi:hypothetical protein